MNISDGIARIVHYFQRPNKTARFAKERLQIIIAHDKALELIPSR